MRYYYLRDDSFNRNAVPGRWYLGRLRYIENYELLTPTVEFMEPGFWHLEVLQDGVETDFSLNGPCGLPIISKKVKEALSDIWEIEKPYQHTVIEPIILTNKETDNEYFIMITEDAIDCVDESRSNFEKFVENDPVRPDLAGRYRGFFSLVIDPERVKGHNIFRIKDYEPILIVSEEVKKRFEAVGATGTSFESVNGDCKTVA